MLGFNPHQGVVPGNAVPRHNTAGARFFVRKNAHGKIADFREAAANQLDGVNGGESRSRERTSCPT